MSLAGYFLRLLERSGARPSRRGTTGSCGGCWPRACGAPTCCGKPRPATPWPWRCFCSTGPGWRKPCRPASRSLRWTLGTSKRWPPTTGTIPGSCSWSRCWRLQQTALRTRPAASPRCWRDALFILNVSRYKEMFRGCGGGAVCPVTWRSGLAAGCRWPGRWSRWSRRAGCGSGRWSPCCGCAASRCRR